MYRDCSFIKIVRGASWGEPSFGWQSFAHCRPVDVARLTGQLIPTPEDSSSNLVLGHYNSTFVHSLCVWGCVCVEKTKNIEKRPKASDKISILWAAIFAKRLSISWHLGRYLQLQVTLSQHQSGSALDLNNMMELKAETWDLQSLKG